MVINLDNHASFIEGDIRHREKFHQVMWYSAKSQMLDQNPHRRLIREAALLLVESKVCCVQMDDQRRRVAPISPEDVLITLD
jgi:hypothetical protein